MENAVDALKIAFAVFVFVMALALALAVIGQVRTTSDVILALGDKTNEYEYVELNENNANNKDRIVGFETILPTIYRYPSEQYAVTILNTNGTPIVRYDLFTENFMNNWDRTLSAMNSGVERRRQEVESNYNAIKDRIAIVDEMISRDSNYSSWTSKIWDSLVKGNLLYAARAEVGSGQVIKQGAPWGSDTNEILKRIKADIDGTDYTRNKITYEGKGLNQYKDRRFKEKFIEIQTSGTTITEDEYSLETVKGNKKLEIVYIMQPD